MQRILEPGQIETLAQRSIPRIRLPDAARLFAGRAARLRSLAECHRTLGDYLRLMATLVEVQHGALARFDASRPTGDHVASARAHGMPILPATASPRGASWRDVLSKICATVGAVPGVPAGAREVCEAVPSWPVARIEAQADQLLAGAGADVDAAAAPFVMAALQVVWTGYASKLDVDDVAELGAPGVCPVCGTLPVASIVRSNAPTHGYRYLHCALCATEFHRVRVTCTHCGSTERITYETVEGGPEAVRAECCGKCRGYRKILYQEKDPSVEPVADDLASLALDLLLTDAGFHRASGNPLLWQPRG